MAQREYKTLRALRRGEVVTIDGQQYKMTEGKPTGIDLEPGDLYFAERNTQQIFHVQSVNMEGQWVNPVEMGYPFDLGECVGITPVNN